MDDARSLCRPDCTAPLRDLLARRILVIDGAMGTMVQGYRLGEDDYRGKRFRDWGQDLKGNNDLLVLTQPAFGIGGTSLINPFGAFVALTAAFLVAVISFQIQDLNKTEAPWSIVFWFTAFTTPLMALALPFVIQPHDTQTWSIIIAMACCGAVAQILLTASLRFGSAGVILLMDYTALLWATFYGWSVFERTPSASLWLGAPLIIAAGLLIAWRERRLAVNKARSAVPAEPNLS